LCSEDPGEETIRLQNHLNYWKKQKLDLLHCAMVRPVNVRDSSA